jgi:hypothetical protein
LRIRETRIQEKQADSHKATLNESWGQRAQRFTKKKNNLIMLLSSNIPVSLFWDMDVSKLDWDRHKQLIVERVIQRGTLKAIKEVTNHYGIGELKSILKQLPYLDKRDIAFVHIYFDIPLNELKCYTRKPLAQNFLN